MRIDSFVSTNSLPVVRSKGGMVRIDFGTVVMELTLNEAVSLVGSIMTCNGFHASESRVKSEGG